MTKIFLTAALVLLAGCSSGPPPPRSGTPEYYFATALDNYNKGDYAKADDWLAKMAKSESEIANKTRVWRLVLQGGRMQGLRELADYYEFGARANKDKPGPFHKKVADYRNAAAALSMELAETYDGFVKASPSGDVALHFPFPPRGSLGRPPAMTRIGAGQLPSQADIETTAAQMVERGIVSTAAEFAGAGGDAAKAQAAYKATPATAPRAALQLAAAKLLYEASAIFGSKKRNDPPRQEFLLKRVKTALAEADKSAKEAKELELRIKADEQDIAKRKK